MKTKSQRKGRGNGLHKVDEDQKLEKVRGNDLHKVDENQKSEKSKRTFNLSSNHKND
ncbi:hypothetical protein [Metabacillus litoralis]|uniref:hypothetical protein n=1 Tax=Metabacillus litoralis TaxID=152268 RepID=UPI002040EC72|nr:hypothetical protein [Metabacillus litoralis]MCM3161837.1 hypothetical protein [Metabacillus litoralis]